MNRDDPFAEPADTDRTVIIPNPGGRRPAAAVGAPPAMPAPGAPDPAAPAPGAQPASAPAAAGAEVAIESAATGLNPLNAAASTLFSLVGRLRNRAQHPDPAALRESVIGEIRAFETRALRAGYPAETVKLARYALCATLDDVVLNTPWGGRSVWPQRSLVGTFHKETHGGDRVWDLLKRLEAEPSQNRDLLEFLYVCLSLGFEGRLRVEPQGAEKHREIRAGLARLIRAQRGAAEPELAPRWKGLELAHRPLSAWTPVWLIAGLTLAGACVAFLAFSWALSGETERLRGQLEALRPDGPVTLARAAPPPPPPPEPVQETRSLAQFLAPEIAEGLVEVFAAGNALTVRLTGEAIFAPASDALEPRFVAVVDRVAQALEEEPGRVIVAGHSDSQPIRTARFPSNLALSLARAQSVMTRIAAALSDPSRLTAEGRADDEPIADNATREGRARNRRIEILLVKAG
ncbi:type VI secretion system protein TssL, long form [Albimonas pacifica]|uniref:Type VI secretion system protein ImpK n=1 Tax=Albimonas pacifica TaxID=1114924 RepID=A0A1I3CZM7_9RHOB|nr:type VI secretion system protein TssL, long form [Albimonas pacifica]SFH79964.1 type VI secretion system protein ImpK [Albimonas pacifica]